ncbi:MAG: LamG domain-containing protein, partial [Gammaproteobacteria bacterium]|nr:LamG domain-containing protein [Gammaproteobacteria bacterium]
MNRNIRKWFCGGLIHSKIASGPLPPVDVIPRTILGFTLRAPRERCERRRNFQRLFFALLFSLALTPGAQAARITTGQQVLYTFEEGSGSTVTDVSGTGTPLNLTIATPAAVSWVPGGLSINSSAVIASAGSANEVINAVQTSNALTIEAWLIPANTTQSGPARIVSLSQDLYARNFTLGQQQSAFDVRLRSTATSNNGTPSTGTAGLVTTALTHVVYTRDAAGVAMIYINGTEQAGTTISGNLSNWDGGYRLALANELTGDRPWRGELHLVAIFDRALSAADISQNYSAGAN